MHASKWLDPWIAFSWLEIIPPPRWSIEGPQQKWWMVASIDRWQLTNHLAEIRLAKHSPSNLIVIFFLFFLIPTSDLFSICRNTAVLYGCRRVLSEHCAKIIHWFVWARQMMMMLMREGCWAATYTVYLVSFIFYLNILCAIVLYGFLCDWLA